MTHRGAFQPLPFCDSVISLKAFRGIYIDYMERALGAKIQVENQQARYEPVPFQQQ